MIDQKNHPWSSQLPNFISLFRLIFAPLLGWMMWHKHSLVIPFFLLLAFSDWLDGFVARRLGVTSSFGELIDPVADKMLITVIYIALGFGGHLAGWLIGLVLLRDGLIIMGAGIILNRQLPLSLKPSKISKINTVAQLGLAALMISGFSIQLPPFLILGGEILVAATTVLSGLAYFWMVQKSIILRKIEQACTTSSSLPLDASQDFFCEMKKVSRGRSRRP